MNCILTTLPFFMLFKLLDFLCVGSWVHIRKCISTTQPFSMLLVRYFCSSLVFSLVYLIWLFSDLSEYYHSSWWYNLHDIWDDFWKTKNEPSNIKKFSSWFTFKIPIIFWRWSSQMILNENFKKLIQYWLTL